MPVTLSELTNAIVQNKPALLLGAGASLPSDAPAATGLALLLARKLSTEQFTQDLPLATIAEVLEIKYGRRRVIDVIQSELKVLTPRGGISAIPLFPWRNIYSTNYDTLIEQAYANHKIPLTVIRSDYDYPALDESDSNVLYKIHGCITQDRSLGDRASMVLTESDYLNPSKYRDTIFSRLDLEVSGSGILIVGHSLGDKHLSDLVREIANKQIRYGYRNKIFILSYESDANRALILENQNITVAFGGIDEFMDELLEQSSDVEGRFVQESRYENLEFPGRLVAASADVAVEVGRKPRVDAMFSGRPATYAEIASGFTFPRTVENRLNGRYAAGHRIITIIGVAGVGKTTAARRFIFDKYQSGLRCWEHKAGFRLRPDAWFQLHIRLVEQKQKGLLLLDEVTNEQRFANRLVDMLGRTRSTYGLYVVATAETSQWTPRQKSPEFFRNEEPLRMSRLDSTEVDSLVRLVETNESIRNLAAVDFRNKSTERKRNHLLRHSESDMFVSLKVLFSSDSLDTILLREYAGIDELPQSVYRIVCALEASGLAIHRQLVLRILPIEPAYIATCLASLEELVEEHTERAEEGVYVWQTRHPKIAETITKYKFSEEEEYLQLLHQVISQINPSVYIERRFIADICNSNYGIRRIRDSEDRISLYEKLLNVDPSNRIPRHRLIREFLNIDDINAASAAIADAEDAVGSDPPLQRYKVLAMIENSRQEDILIEDRQAILKAARREALEGIKQYPDNKYQYFVFDEVARVWHDIFGDDDWLNESLKYLNSAFQDILDPELGERARMTERLLRRNVN